MKRLLAASALAALFLTSSRAQEEDPNAKNLEALAANARTFVLKRKMEISPNGLK